MVSIGNLIRLSLSMKDGAPSVPDLVIGLLGDIMGLDEYPE